VNLLLVNYEYPPVGGGAANATQFLGRALLELGHSVDVLTSGLSGSDGTSVEDGMRIHRLPIGRRHLDRASQWEMLTFLRQSVAAVSRLQQVQRWEAAIAFFTIPSGPAALRLHRLGGAPYVVSLRGGGVPGPVPGLGFKHLLTRPLRRSVLRHASAIIANSEGLATTSRMADPFPVAIVPNGVDCAVFHPADRRPEPAGARRLRLLFVGRLHPEKNLGVVLSQFAALPASIRDRIELHVAGDGSQRAELKLLAEKLGLAAQIQWLGWQAKPGLPTLYRGADALVNPSQYEGMSNVVLEAMASGLPVFASDVPGNRAVVLPGRTGILFPLQKPAQLGSALAGLVTDPAWGRALGEAGRERALADFSWKRAAESYLELLR
jgi:glycosyltransferase involved in cell wall biosynthesis